MTSAQSTAADPHLLHLVRFSFSINKCFHIFTFYSPSLSLSDTQNTYASRRTMCCKAAAADVYFMRHQTPYYSCRSPLPFCFRRQSAEQQIHGIVMEDLDYLQKPTSIHRRGPFIIVLSDFFFFFCGGTLVNHSEEFLFTQRNVLQRRGATQRMKLCTLEDTRV